MFCPNSGNGSTRVACNSAVKVGGGITCSQLVCGGDSPRPPSSQLCSVTWNYAIYEPHNTLLPAWVGLKASARTTSLLQTLGQTPRMLCFGSWLGLVKGRCWGCIFGLFLAREGIRRMSREGHCFPVPFLISVPVAGLDLQRVPRMED